MKLFVKLICHIKAYFRIFFKTSIDPYHINHHRYVVTLIFLLLVILTSSLFFLIDIFIAKLYTLATMNVFIALGGLCLLIYIKKTENISSANHYVLIFIMLTTNGVFYINENQTFTYIWALFFPVLPFFMVGKRLGVYYLFAHIGIVSLITINGLYSWQAAEYTYHSLFRIHLALLLVGLFMYLYESNRAKAFKRLDEYKSNLEIRVQEEIKKQQESQLLLTQQSKMAALGEMLASVSHQWKQPLGVISSTNTNLELDNTLGDVTSEIIQEHTKIISEQIIFMTQTLTEFGDFFKPNKHKESFCIESAFEDILRLFSKLYESQNIKININTQQCTSIYGHKNEFRQVVLNILNNARDVIVEKNVQNRAIDINFTTTQSEVICKIQDHAGGVPVDILETLFEPFVTTKSDDKGTGIGLYMSKNIIESSMQGSLHVQNINDGACFIISLPQHHHS